jgi:triosephosphate isomerase
VNDLFVANWKMHKTAAQTAAFFDAFLPLLASLPPQTDIAIAPPFTSRRLRRLQPLPSA